MQDSVPLIRHPHLTLQETPHKGRGVFATQPIAAGTIIDVCPVLVLDEKEFVEHVGKTALFHYTYDKHLDPQSFNNSNWTVKSPPSPTITTATPSTPSLPSAIPVSTLESQSPPPSTPAHAENPTNKSAKTIRAKSKTLQALVLGLGSMFNHSTQGQNVAWTRDERNQTVTYRAIRDIGVGEELCISYGSRLTFVDGDVLSEGDDEEQNGEHLLNKIDLDFT